MVEVQHTSRTGAILSFILECSNFFCCLTQFHFDIHLFQLLIISALMQPTTIVLDALSTMHLKSHLYATVWQELWWLEGNHMSSYLRVRPSRQVSKFAMTTEVATHCRGERWGRLSLELWYNANKKKRENVNGKKFPTLKISNSSRKNIPIIDAETSKTRRK